MACLVASCEPPRDSSNAPLQHARSTQTTTPLLSCNPLEVNRISFSGPHGELVLWREQAGGPLQPRGQQIEGFDERTAAQLVSTACGLRAREKLDVPSGLEAAGLAGGATRLELSTHSRQNLVVTIGKDDVTRRLTYVEVSTSPGIFLVPLHIGRALRVGPSRFTRTPQQVAMDDEAARASAAHAAIHERHADTQAPSAVSPAPYGTHRSGETVSPAVLEELRREARRETGSMHRNVLAL